MVGRTAHGKEIHERADLPRFHTDQKVQGPRAPEWGPGAGAGAAGPGRGAPGGDSPAGEILLQGPSVFAGYYRQPELTAEATVPDPLGGTPFFRTGDIGEVRGGVVRIVDRKKNIFKLSQVRYLQVAYVVL